MAATNEKLPLEILFWTHTRNVERIQNNSYEKVKAASRSAVWTDDNEVIKKL